MPLSAAEQELLDELEDQFLIDIENDVVALRLMALWSLLLLIVVVAIISWHA